MTLDLPSALSDRVLNALKADPRTVDLRSLAPHFYSLGIRVLELFEEEEMADILGDVSERRRFLTRLASVSRCLSLPPVNNNTL